MECKTCMKEFVIKYKNQKYCNMLCRYRYIRVKRVIEVFKLNDEDKLLRERIDDEK